MEENTDLSAIVALPGQPAGHGAQGPVRQCGRQRPWPPQQQPHPTCTAHLHSFAGELSPQWVRSFRN